MVDTLGMAIPDGIQDLEERAFGLVIVTDIVIFFGDLGKQITFGTILENDERAFRAVQNLGHGNNVVVLAGPIMQLNFAFLELPLSGVEAGLVQGFDGIFDVRLHVQRLVHGAVGTSTKDTGQVVTASERRPEAIHRVDEFMWFGGGRRGEVHNRG